MIEIQLTQGKTAIIDDQHAELANRSWYAWRSRNVYYAVRTIHDSEKKGARIYLHRAVMALKIGRSLSPDEHIDHINGDGLDNRAENLRLATGAENTLNRGKPKHNTSGYKGVSRGQGVWRARIALAGKARFLGYFDSPEAAAIAYNLAAIELHGEFARLNVL